jgi:hypothetical protein
MRSKWTPALLASSLLSGATASRIPVKDEVSTFDDGATSVVNLSTQASESWRSLNPSNADSFENDSGRSEGSTNSPLGEGLTIDPLEQEEPYQIPSLKDSKVSRDEQSEDQQRFRDAEGDVALSEKSSTRNDDSISDKLYEEYAGHRQHTSKGWGRRTRLAIAGLGTCALGMGCCCGGRCLSRKSRRQIRDFGGRLLRCCCGAKVPAEEEYEGEGPPEGKPGDELV